MLTARFDSSLGPVEVGLGFGSVTLVAGPNGVGKSALLYRLYKSLGQVSSTYLPGYRQINLNQNIDQLSQDILQLRQNLFTHFEAANRYKGAWSEDQFKATLRVLVHSENAYNRSFRLNVAAEGEAHVPEASQQKSPIDKINVIFERAGLPVRIDLTNLGLTAVKGTSTYAIEALSDGERAALFIAAAVITQDEKTVLLIDEPEKHLHPSISALLIESAIRAAPTIAVVVSSHDLNLIEKLGVQATIYVKNSEVVSVKPEQRVFDVELLSQGEIPEKLRIDVLGARARLLYVEGTNASRDAALYSTVYKDWKIVSKGGSEKVIEAARALRSAAGFVWLQVAGLVDGDGRDAAEKARLRAQGIMALPVPTIENLFFLTSARACFVAADLQMRGGLAFASREHSVGSVILAAAAADRDNIIARRTLWLAQRAIASHPLRVRDIRDSVVEEITVDVASIKATVKAEVDALIQDGNYRKIITRLPIKNTDIPELTAKALGATSFKNYYDVIQHQIDLATPGGLRFCADLRQVLPRVDSLPSVIIPYIVQPGTRRVGLPPPPSNPFQPPVINAS